ncbi:MAG: cytochrome c biogenesis protein ResB [Alphaproteobacteria bacterium]|nr:cytochrome c biogenesis protein ResB [Alphaproteobacteria bacterium]
MWVMPVLMAYLIAGTVAQKYIGLYDATRIFFSSPLVWLGPLPLPGLPILLAIIFLNLTFNLLFKSPWSLEKSGVITIHIGVMLLLVGGLMTALFSVEGYVTLPPGQIRATMTDYHERDLLVTDDQGQVLYAFAHDDLKGGESLNLSNLPFSLKILDACRNCAVEKRTGDSAGFEGMAAAMRLVPDRPRASDEENIAGTTVYVEPAGQKYILIEDLPKTPEFRASDGKTYRLALRRRENPLPFSVTLLDFERDLHPGTQLARAYRSRVRITDGKAQWESDISMNQPLRYRGYTLYQSSYLETPNGDVSVLAVVRNAGRAFPYLSGITVCVGLVLHLIMRARKNKKTGAANA